METNFKKHSTIFTVFFLLALIGSTTSKLYEVKSIKDLQIKIDNASEGDTITLANGMYKDSFINVKSNGLVIQAQTAGKVFFTGASNIVISGNKNKIIGFQFTNGSLEKGKVVIDIKGNNNLISHCNWKGYSAEKYIVMRLGTQYNTVSYCNMEDKPANAPIGCLIQILPAQDTPNYHKISHCTFKNMPGNGGDYGNEPIRIGLGAVSKYPSRSVVEYCYFKNTGLADSESISVKSQENVLRYNVFDQNVGGMLVFRNGDKNIAYSNIFIRGSGGIRVKEANDILCFNNYFDGSNSTI